jgi:hypothetical protein
MSNPDYRTPLPFNVDLTAMPHSGNGAKTVHWMMEHGLKPWPRGPAALADLLEKDYPRPPATRIEVLRLLALKRTTAETEIRQKLYGDPWADIGLQDLLTTIRQDIDHWHANFRISTKSSRERATGVTWTIEYM